MAQVKGQYTPKPQKPEETELPPTVPRVFSSKVTSPKMAEKLDLKYYDLITVLNGYAEADLSYRVRLMELMEPYKFQITRRKEEFEKDIIQAKNTLKDNYKNIQALIADFDKDFSQISKGFSKPDQKALNLAHKAAVGTFERKSKEYFDLQADFIKNYSHLVRFILENGGGYYFEEARQSVMFYNAGHYNTFGKYIDKLNKIGFAQGQIIKSFDAGPPL